MTSSQRKHNRKYTDNNATSLFGMWFCCPAFPRLIIPSPLLAIGPPVSISLTKLNHISLDISMLESLLHNGLNAWNFPPWGRSPLHSAPLLSGDPGKVSGLRFYSIPRSALYCSTCAKMALPANFSSGLWQGRDREVSREALREWSNRYDCTVLYRNEFLPVHLFCKSK